MLYLDPRAYNSTRPKSEQSRFNSHHLKQFATLEIESKNDNKIDIFEREQLIVFLLQLVKLHAYCSIRRNRTSLGL